LIDLISAPIRI